MTPITAEQLNKSLASSDWPHFDELLIDEDVIDPDAIDSDDDSLVTNQTIKYSLTINPELSYLAGHFPQQPIVPGVVQVHWAGELSKQFFQCNKFSKLKKVKFINPILPNTTLALSLSYKTNLNQVNFVFSNDSQIYSSGVISFL